MFARAAMAALVCVITLFAGAQITRPRFYVPSNSKAEIGPTVFSKSIYVFNSAKKEKFVGMGDVTDHAAIELFNRFLNDVFQLRVGQNVCILGKEVNCAQPMLVKALCEFNTSSTSHFIRGGTPAVFHYDLDLEPNFFSPAFCFGPNECRSAFNNANICTKLALGCFLHPFDRFFTSPRSANGGSRLALRTAQSGDSQTFPPSNLAALPNADDGKNQRKNRDPSIPWHPEETAWLLIGLGFGLEIVGLNYYYRPSRFRRQHMVNRKFWKCIALSGVGLVIGTIILSAMFGL